MKCINCGREDLEKVARAKDRKILECINCGLGGVSPFPSKGGIAKTIDDVSEKFFQDYQKEEKSYTSYFKKKLDDIASYEPVGRLLDVGCGPGLFMKLAQERGWQVVGVDLSEEAVKKGKKDKITIKHGTLDSAKLGQNMFDVITGFQLIEHVQKPDALLRKMSARIKKGGLIVITTPDKKGFLAQLSGKHWFEYYNKEHLFFFNQKSLREMIEKAGFEVITCKTEFGRRLDLPYVWDRLLNYYYTKDTKAHKFVAAFNFVPKLLGRVVIIREPWVNIYLIARKK